MLFAMILAFCSRIEYSKRSAAAAETLALIDLSQAFVCADPLVCKAGSVLDVFEDLASGLGLAAGCRKLILWGS
jgi:hypothetical protein